MMLTALAFALFAAAPACQGSDTPLPRALAGWRRTARGLDTGHSVILPAEAGKAITRVTIRKAGIFGIAADQEGWIDVYRGRGKPLRMASESKGPACSGISKIVRYRLQPGSYRVEIGRLRRDRVRLMLVHGDVGAAGLPGRARSASRGANSRKDAR